MSTPTGSPAAGNVWAFEPQKKVHAELVRNIALNDLHNVKAPRMAISSKPGTVHMQPVGTTDGRTHVGKEGEEVEARTVDSFHLRNVSLIKIDVRHRGMEDERMPFIPTGFDRMGLSIGKECKANLFRSPEILQSCVCPRAGSAASS